MMAAQQAPATNANNSNNNSQKIRHEWFQSDQHVVVSVFVKNARADAVRVDFQPRQLAVEIQLPTVVDPSSLSVHSGNDAGAGQKPSTALFCLDIDPLFAAIEPQECAVTVGKVKVEIKLKKRVAGVHWPQLEAAGDDVAVGAMPMNAAAAVPVGTCAQ